MCMYIINTIYTKSHSYTDTHPRYKHIHRLTLVTHIYRYVRGDVRLNHVTHL